MTLTPTSIKVPADLPTGDYVLGFRYDCEATAQIWSNCEFWRPATGTQVALGCLRVRLKPRAQRRCGHHAHPTAAAAHTNRREDVPLREGHVRRQLHRRFVKGRLCEGVRPGRVTRACTRVWSSCRRLILHAVFAEHVLRVVDRPVKSFSVLRQTPWPCVQPSKNILRKFL